MKHRFLGCGMCALVLACAIHGCTNSEPVDIGDDDPVALGASLSDYAGSWSGYAEAHQFDDGTDSVRLTLDANGSGGLEVGDAAPLPPPDPERGYPPGEDPQGFSGRLYQGDLASGFSYSIDGAVVEARRIRVRMASTELYSEWCALQTPVLDTVNVQEGGSYLCIPNLGMTWDDRGCQLLPESGPPIPIDCGKYELCTSICFCTATGCSVDTALDTQIDAALESGGDELEGTLLIGGSRINVRMIRE